MAHHIRPYLGVHSPLAGASPLPGGPGCLWLRLEVVFGLRRGGQWLEEVGDVAEALLDVQIVDAPHGSSLSPLPGLWLGDNGGELKVLTIHRDVRSQSLQVQVTRVRLREREPNRGVKIQCVLILKQIFILKLTNI